MKAEAGLPGNRDECSASSVISLFLKAYAFIEGRTKALVLDVCVVIGVHSFSVAFFYRNGSSRTISHSCPVVLVCAFALYCQRVPLAGGYCACRCVLLRSGSVCMVGFCGPFLCLGPVPRILVDLIRATIDANSFSDRQYLLVSL